MARLNTQNIPVDLADLYAKTIAPTYSPSRLGSQLPSLTSVTRSHYPAQIEPPHVPTTAQLKLRAAFNTCQNALQRCEPTEAHAWWQLALGSGMTYGDFFTHTFLPDLYRDTLTPNDIQFPDTCLTEPPEAPNLPTVQLEIPTFEPCYLYYHTAIDPGTRLPRLDIWAPLTAYFIRHRLDLDNGYWYYSHIILTSYNTPEYYNQKSWLNVPDSQIPYTKRTVTFYKRITETDRRCILFDFRLEGHETDTVRTLHAFNGPENPSTW